MLDFKCPECGDTKLYLINENITSTGLHFFKEGEFDFGTENIRECIESALECGNGHVLVFKSGVEISDFDEFATWTEEQNDGSFKDPFGLHDINRTASTEKDIERAAKVSKELIIILNVLARKIIEEITDVYDSHMNNPAIEIRALRFADVGIGDTVTDDLICGYLANKLKDTFDTKDIDEITSDFYNLIH